MEYKVEILPNGFAALGEGPHWDVGTQSLYYIDMYGAAVYRYDYNENKIYKAMIENEKISSFVIPIEGESNQFAIGLGLRVGIIEWDGISNSCKVIKNVFEVETDDEKYKNNRFNDAKSDPVGRFFGGTMRTDLIGDLFDNRLGNFYRYDKNGIKHLKGDIGVSNGLTWNVERKKFYYVDTCDYDIKEYDYNIDTGDINFTKKLCDFGKDNGLPDGMTIDTNGFLYVAMFNGSKICKVNADDGKIEMEIKLPCEQITSVAFGGPNLDVLFATTAAKLNKPLPAGETYKITGLGVTGLPMTKLNFTK